MHWLLKGALLFVGVTVLTVIVAHLMGDPWLGMTDSSSNEQCEAWRRGEFIRTPFNTWSNLAYLATGCLIAVRQPTLLRASTGAFIVLVFLGSGLFHASMTHAWQTVDIAVIYIAMLALFFYGLGCLTPLSNWVQVSLAAGAFVAGSVMGKLKDSVFESTWTFIGLVVAFLTLAVIGLIRGPRASPRRLLVSGLGAVTTFGCGVFFKFVDGKNNAICCANCGVQPHGLWHVFSAAALFFLYDFFTSFNAADDAGVLGLEA